MIFNIAGFSYRGSLKDVKKGDILQMVPDPTNPYDSNAIKIVSKDGKHLGFVPKNMTHRVQDSGKMSNGVVVRSCEMSYEVLVELID
jgi:hypothetical protein